MRTGSIFEALYLTMPAGLEHLLLFLSLVLHNDSIDGKRCRARANHSVPEARDAFAARALDRDRVVRRVAVRFLVVLLRFPLRLVDVKGDEKGCSNLLLLFLKFLQGPSRRRGTCSASRLVRGI